VPAKLGGKRKQLLCLEGYGFVKEKVDLLEVLNFKKKWPLQVKEPAGEQVF
jgi:hypothetical protein